MRTWLISLLLLLTPPLLATEKTDAAAASANRWLQQLDQGQYQQAYAASGLLMQNAVSFAPWQQAIEKARGALGIVHMRELTYGALEKELPGVGPGEYVKLRYRTDFATKYKVTESITLMLETDGKWRTIGYSVQ